MEFYRIFWDFFYPLLLIWLKMAWFFNFQPKDKFTGRNKCTRYPMRGASRPEEQRSPPSARRQQRRVKINITIHYSLFTFHYSLSPTNLYSTNLLIGGNPQPIGGERKVQLIMFTYLNIAVIVRITEVFWIPAYSLWLMLRKDAGMTGFFVLHNSDNCYNEICKIFHSTRDFLGGSDFAETTAGKCSEIC